MGLFGSRSGKLKGTSRAMSVGATGKRQSPDARAEREQRQQHDDESFSNLSTTSTLQSPPAKERRQSRSTRRTSYEEFMRQSETAERKRVEREDRIAQAWMKAAERRNSARSADSWRGGFGPPASKTQVGGMRPRKVEEENQGVKAWLGQNGLTRK